MLYTIGCVTCGAPLLDPEEPGQLHMERARAVLLDPGEPGDGTGGLYILMPYVISMSAAAGPYCYQHAREQLRKLNAPRA